MDPGSTTLLLRQSLHPCDPKLRFRQWTTISRLAPSDADAIGALGDNSISLFVHLAQVARIECEMDMLGFTGTERYPLERAQSANRRDRRLWKNSSTAPRLRHLRAGSRSLHPRPRSGDRLLSDLL